MKRQHLILLISLLCSYYANAQSVPWVSYSKAMDVSKYEGSTFRIQASIRADAVGKASAAYLWARIDCRGGQGFFYNMKDRPVQNDKWDTYSFEGKIDTGTFQLAFGALYGSFGKFYYHVVKTEVRNKYCRRNQAAGL